MNQATETPVTGGSVGNDGSPSRILPAPIFHPPLDWYRSIPEDQEKKQAVWQPWIEEVLKVPEEKLKLQIISELLFNLRKDDFQSLYHLATHPLLPQNILHLSLVDREVQQLVQERRILSQLSSGIQGAKNAIEAKRIFRISPVWLSKPDVKKLLEARVRILFGHLARLCREVTNAHPETLPLRLQEVRELCQVIKQVAREFDIPPQFIRDTARDLIRELKEQFQRSAATKIELEFENFV